MVQSPGELEGLSSKVGVGFGQAGWVKGTHRYRCARRFDGRTRTVFSLIPSVFPEGQDVRLSWGEEEGCRELPRGSGRREGLKSSMCRA